MQQKLKQTEIGVMPEDWDTHNILKNSTLKGRIGWQGLTTSEYLEKGDYFLVTGTDFKNGKIDWEHCFFVEEKRYSQDKYIQLKVGDVLVTKDGTIGKIAYIDRLPKPATLNSGVFVIRPKNNEYNTLFFFYILSSEFFDRFLNKLKAGSTISHLYQKDFSSFDFILPPTKEEQSAIASVLSDTDILIEQLDKLIVKKKNIKQGAMQELLTGKRRLPGFKGEWKVTTLGKVANFEHGYGLSKAELNEDGLHKCIHYGQLFTEYKELIKNTKSRTDTTSNVVYSQENDVLMPTSDVTPRGLATASCIKEKGILLGGGILIIRLHSGYDGVFLSYFVNQNKNAILRLVKGSTVFHLYASDLSNLEISFPEYAEQKAITSIIIDMNSEIEELEEKRDKYLRLKAGMMQQLLTGRVRLKC